MPAPILAGAALGVGLASSAYSLYNAFGAAGAKRRATNEAVRRTRLQYDRVLSEATALGNASGVASDSTSLQTYLTTMATEMQKSLDWMRQSGQTEADLMQVNGIFGAATDVSRSIFSYGGMMGWYK